MRALALALAVALSPGPAAAGEPAPKKLDPVELGWICGGRFYTQDEMYGYPTFTDLYCTAGYRIDAYRGMAGR